MKIHSLGLRLILLGFFSITLALSTTTYVLNNLFYNYFVDRIYLELDQHLKQLTANLSVDEDNNIKVSPLLDPRYSLPFSGLYWQAVEEGGEALSSRSLWGNPLKIPTYPTPGQQQKYTITSDQGIPLLAMGWGILLGNEENQRSIYLLVATDESDIITAVTDFRNHFLQWLALMFAGLILASALQVRFGLAPLEALRKKVGQVRSGEESKLTGNFPSEVQPLADEVNELLALHNSSLESARTRASDLAHGLKTPLTVMLTLARDLRRHGNDGVAEDIEGQVASMRHYIERELARVRTQIPSAIHTEAPPVITRMVNAIQKFPRVDPLEWQVNMPDSFGTPFDEHDLSELLGNILDNARKWAKSVVRLDAEMLDDGRKRISIHDDGSGVPDDQLQSILTRGQRLDPSVQGTGLGLAICYDMAESHGATLELKRSDLGGLAVSITW